MRISDWSSDVCSSDLIDWTAGNRNTLTAASVKQLKAMPDPLTFYVFAPSGAETRHAIEADLERYKRVKNNITVTFVDPSADPQKVREFNVNYVGQIVAEYDGRRQTLDATTERSEEHTSELQSLMRISYAVFCLTK